MLTRRALLAATPALAAAGCGNPLAAYDQVARRQRRPLGVEPAITELIRFATLAPNGHNAQPWRFRVAGDAVTILPDRTRALAVTDPDDHHLYVALGCAAENLLLAGAARGRPGMASAGAEGVTLQLERGYARASLLFDAIPHRQSTRADYSGQPVSTDDLRALEAAGDSGAVAVRLVTDRRQIAQLEPIINAGTAAQMDDPRFHAELLAWLRFSPEAALRTGDGLFSATSGNPVMPEGIARRAFPLLFRKQGEIDRYRGQILSSAGLAIFTGDRADPEHWVAVGRAVQRFCLQATGLGIRTAFINQPVEVPAVRRELAGWLGAPDARPDLVVRFGFAKALPMSLRRPVSAVVEAS